MMMMKKILFVFIALAIHDGALGFYYRKMVSTGRQGTNLREAKIVVTKESSVADKTFPDEFKLIYTQNGKEVNCVFTTNHSMIERPATASNLFIIDGPGDLKQVEGTDVAMESYWSSQCNGSALLHDNEYMRIRLNLNPSTKFRALITIDGENTHVDIVTVIYETRGVGKSGVESQSVVYEAFHRDPLGDFGHDYEFVNNAAIHESIIKKVEEATSDKKKKRAVGGQPVQLYVECVLVADYSAYQKHMTNANSADQNTVLIYMKIFYSHLLNSINRRYINTFLTDPDIQIQVRLTNIVIHTTNAESTWTDSVNVGITGDPTYTYNGRLVVVATPALSAFRDFMNARTFSFTYDHAIGVTDRDIWANTGANAAARTGVAGFAYVNPVCESSRYSINEDRGFNSILFIAHEIGHNLGASHDGDSTYASACSTTDNYIMTPVVGANSANLLNYYKFSPCSIASFKSNLLDSVTGALKTAKSCLANVPVSTTDLELAYFNSSMAGQVFSLNDQCQLVYGVASSADTCSWAVTDVCETMYCTNGVTTSCWSSPGRGALEGTSCGTNMVCSMGVCVSNSVTLATNFPSNACAVNPCQNGGVCVAPTIGRFYICNCAAGFGGQRCEIGGVTTVSTAAPVPGATTQAAGTTTQYTGPTTPDAQAGKSDAFRLQYCCMTYSVAALISLLIAMF